MIVSTEEMQSRYKAFLVLSYRRENTKKSREQWPVRPGPYDPKGGKTEIAVLALV